MPAIRVEDLHKYYGEVHALDGLSLTVEPGKVFGFLGPNGAGKTTAIRILTGLAHATKGRAWIGEAEVTGDGREAARLIGYLPEDPGFYRWMTPSEFLDHVGRVFGLTASERAARVKELLELAGLTEVGKRKIGGFSRGMRQRLGLAQALVNRPQVLLLDEPVSALDPAGRKEVLEMIENLGSQCTVFMSTHILDDVERVCDTVGIITHGRLVVQAPRHELLARYAVPIFEVDVDHGYEGPLNQWGESLRKEKWVQSASISELTARIVVDDVEAAKRDLLATALQSGMVLTRFEMLHPSLEDVFLRLVGERENR